MNISYILIFKVNNKEINVGKLGKIYFNGKYAYIGKDKVGYRIKRHLSKIKKNHWHIDYVIKHSKIEQIIIIENAADYEEKLAKYLNEKFEYVENFGSSDSKAKSHLLKIKDIEKLIKAVDEFCRKENLRYKMMIPGYLIGDDEPGR